MPLNTSQNEIYKIRPAGRHILTIGRDLIQDKFAAIVELVKNAYDADSPDVEIHFQAETDGSKYSISVLDHGHGMSRETVLNKWLVPSTDDKLTRTHSPAGRIMQGRKGIGRYAASILGHDLLFETVTSECQKTTVHIEWKNFESARYLDEVDILVKTTAVNEPMGTRLTMTGDQELLKEWSQEQFNNLRRELKMLIPPVSTLLSTQENTFDIYLHIENFPEVDDIHQIIEPFPILDFYDYRISGKISSDGKGNLIYSCQKSRNMVDEQIDFQAEHGPTGCGELLIDIRAYDRDKEAIDSLISRGLKDDSDNYIGKQQARQILNQINGIGVYRNGFRIRPLGEAHFDWLKLNQQRVQNPSLRVGSNQVVGYVQIQSEELSDLIEKSARDGLKDNQAFKRLTEISKQVISELERKRFIYRQKAGISRPALKIEYELEQMFSFDDMKRIIQKKLIKGAVDTKTREDIVSIIDKEVDNKNKLAENIRQAVAVYQGQATLGKIINVVLHEGRRPLNYFKNQIPNIKYWQKKFTQTNDSEYLDKIIMGIDGLAENSNFFVNLFSRLDPLAAGKRSARKNINIKKAIHDAFSIFDEQIKNGKILLSINSPDNIEIKAWPQDIHAIFINLVDNSIYWLLKSPEENRKIYVDVKTQNSILEYIDFRDTGPGIQSELIASEVIFEPQFTTKPDGTGLGLAIAGEAAYRNNFELKAFETKSGAYFRLQKKEVIS